MAEVKLVIEFSRESLAFSPPAFPIYVDGGGYFGLAVPLIYRSVTQCAIRRPDCGVVIPAISIRSHKDEQDSRRGRKVALRRALALALAKRELRSAIYEAYWSFENAKGQKRRVELMVDEKLLEDSLFSKRDGAQPSTAEWKGPRDIGVPSTDELGRFDPQPGGESVRNQQAG